MKEISKHFSLISCSNHNFPSATSHPSICAKYNKNIDFLYASGCSIIILLNGHRHCSWQTHERNERTNGTTVKAHHSRIRTESWWGWWYYSALHHHDLDRAQPASQPEQSIWMDVNLRTKGGRRTAEVEERATFINWMLQCPDSHTGGTYRTGHVIYMPHDKPTVC